MWQKGISDVHYPPLTYIFALNKTGWTPTVLYSAMVQSTHHLCTDNEFIEQREVPNAYESIMFRKLKPYIQNKLNSQRLHTTGRLFYSVILLLYHCVCKVYTQHTVTIVNTLLKEIVTNPTQKHAIVNYQPNIQYKS